MNMKGLIVTAISAIMCVPLYADHKEGHPAPGGTEDSLSARVAALEAQGDSMLIALSSDQSIGQGGALLGLGSQSNALDDVAVVVPIDGVVAGSTFSIGQNLGQGGTPVAPTTGEWVEVYVVVVPFDADATFPDTYGAPRVTLNTLENFLANNGALTGCTDVAMATDSNYVPIGTQVGGLTVLDSGHVASCDNVDLLISKGDLISVWLRPQVFTSFSPRVTLVIESE